MKIINYCSGGLGNRLKPFGSCYEISKLTQRQLAMVWNPTLRCSCQFNDIFKNSYENVDLNNLDPDTVSIYSNPSYIEGDKNLNGDARLSDLLRKVGHCHPLEHVGNVINDPKENIVIYNNTTLINYDNIEEFLSNLIPVDYISEETNRFCEENKIDKNIRGVHARGTDFSVPFQYYEEKINQIPLNERILFCSDSHEFEQEAKRKWGDRIILKENKTYVSKKKSGSWINNVYTPTESVKDSLVDLYLLSRTNFSIYHPQSTFAHLAKILSKSSNT